MKRKGIEEYLIDMVDQKYAKRVFQKMNTEYERLTLEHGSNPSLKEYEWMVKKALEIHRNMNVTPELEDGDAEKAADQV